MDTNAKQIRMTTEPIPRLVMSLAVPSIISMLITHIYNTADTYFVSQLGTSAAAAVGIAFAFQAIINACGFFFGHGTGNYMSRMLGAKRVEEARSMASTGFFTAFLAGALLAVLANVFLEQLAVGLGSTPTILPYAKDYLRIVSWGAPVMMSSLVLNNQLRFQGSANYGMVGIVSGAIINIGLDPFFIFTLGMGIGGAALATVISQTISLCVLLVMTFRGGNMAIRFSDFCPTAEGYVQIFRGGSPSLFRQGMECVGSIVLNLAAGAFGDAAIAAMSIVGRVIFLLSAIMIGFGQGYQPVCGFNYGAQRYDRVREGFKFCVRTLFYVIAILCIGMIVFAPQIITVFRDDPEVVAIGVKALRYQALTLPITALTILTNMTLQTVGKTFGAILVAVSRRGLFLIPLLLVLPPLYGISGLLVCQSLTDIATTALSFGFIRYFFKHLPQ